jgi:hypothetical protein
MNKTVILFFATIFELAGNSVPMLFGDSGFLSLWGIVGGLIGGLFGIWVGVVISKRLG